MGGDLVETAFLIQGLLAVHQYYVNGNEKEKALAQRIDQIGGMSTGTGIGKAGKTFFTALESDVWLGNEFPCTRLQRMYDYVYSCPPLLLHTEYLRLSIMTVGHRTEPSFLRIKWKESSCTSAIRAPKPDRFSGSIFFPRT